MNTKEKAGYVNKKENACLISEKPVTSINSKLWD